MRRKSERTASKKAKPSPEKKVTEKLKRTRTSKRRKQSTSSEESADEASPVREPEAIVVEQEKKPPQTPTKDKEVTPEDAHEVWTVKTAEARSDTGEIQKLKICLTRPPSTPERADRSPRSRRKHSRATSSSDTPSVEAADDRKKSKHRSKRAARESKDESEKNQDSQGDEIEADSEMPSNEKDNLITQSTEAVAGTVPDETPVSTTHEESKSRETVKEAESDKPQTDEQYKETEIQDKLSSDADTTVASPKADGKGDQTEDSKLPDKTRSESESKDSKQNEKPSESKPENVETTEESGAVHKKEEGTTEQEVSKSEDKSNNSKTEEAESSQSESLKATNDNDVVDSSENHKKERRQSSSSDSMKTKNVERSKERSGSKELEHSDAVNDTRKKQSTEEKNKSKEHESSDLNNVKKVDSKDRRKSKELKHSESAKENESSDERNRGRELERSDSTQSTDEPIHNGQAAPIVVSRKRKWGSRPSKLTTQKSITISSDVLKEIIPDVKPVEFEEVIEEKKKHKRVQSNEKVERPILPKIVIDNTEHMDQHKKEYEDRESDKFKSREPLAANRRISIVKENDSIIARPPSPPRHKQSCILYITNLVRPFTLPQLKNLLQRTGRISENGFWIDRIKSKCFVKYETEDQAVETRHALHGVTWPVSNPKTLQVDFSSQEAFDKARANEETDNAQATTIPGTVEDWLREQDMKREKELEKPWERKAAAVREWDFGKNDKDKEKERPKRDDRIPDKRRHRTPERSPEPARKFKKKEEEAPAKLLDDLFRKTKTTPCIYWLPLSAEMIAIKEEQRRQHMAEHERRLLELRSRTHRRH